MNNDKLENITTDVKQSAVVIPLKLTMMPENTFDFMVSIDEYGHIVLTPLVDNNEFTAVEICNQPVNSAAVVSEEGLTTKYVVLSATMVGDSDNTSYEAAIDNIGQCVICPSDIDSSFVTVFEQPSLNLITEQPEETLYLDKKIIKSDEGYDVYDLEGNLLSKNYPTLAHAKINICEIELESLKSMDNSQENLSKEIVESVEEVAEANKFNFDETLKVLDEITNSFKVSSGAIYCDFSNEVDACVDILETFYNTVTSKSDGSRYLVEYSSKKLSESTSFSEIRDDVLTKFMQGELTVLPADEESISMGDMIHLHELSADGYEYYYDLSTGTVAYINK